MEENNNNEHLYTSIEDKPKSCLNNNCWKQCLAMTFAAFLGGLVAFYLVMDQMMERKFRHDNSFYPYHFEKRLAHDFDKQYRHDKKSFEKMLKHQREMQNDMMRKDFWIPNITTDFMPEEVNIKTDFDDDKFEVKINLKPFQGDENKVNYNVRGRKLTVFGESQVKDKNTEENISFSQDFILPENADISNIQKIKDGKDLIISVPFKK